MITFKGSPLTLQGPPLRVGDTMPGFTLTDTALTEVRDTDLCGIRVFLTVPSLDTGVCDQEVRWFNEKAAELPGVTIVAVSLDLPFAQARWCGGGGIEAVRTLSDYKERRFGKATGTYIEELALLAPRGLRGGRKRYGGIRRGGAGGEQPSQLRGRIPKAPGTRRISPSSWTLSRSGPRMCPV